MEKEAKQLLVMLLLLVGVQWAGAQTTYISLYSFTNGNDGAHPYAGLAQASDGYLYGTTQNGGTNGNGTVFRITTNGVFTPLYSFTALPPYYTNSDGANPYAGLVLAGDGNLYGTTFNGGVYGVGTIFRITTNGVFTPLYSFTGGNDGLFTYAGLVLAGDGNLYGTAYGGGTGIFGTIFRITTAGVLTPVYSFTGGNDGGNPQAALALAGDGNLYGTTTIAGTNNDGTVFRITTNNVFTPIYSFTGYHDGANPDSSLVQGNDGCLYGTANYGGTNNDGSVFRITTNGALTPLHSFNYVPDGERPQAGLVQANDGYLYGTASAGGTNYEGTVFRIATGLYELVYSFTRGNDGNTPLAGLVQASDGNLFGTASGGGTNGFGTVFELVLSPPTLNLLFDGNQSVLSWPAWANNYVLQTTTNLASPNWATLSNATSGMAVTNSLSAQFFRLANP